MSQYFSLGRLLLFLSSITASLIFSQFLSIFRIKLFWNQNYIKTKEEKKNLWTTQTFFISEKIYQNWPFPWEILLNKRQSFNPTKHLSKQSQAKRVNLQALIEIQQCGNATAKNIHRFCLKIYIYFAYHGQKNLWCTEEYLCRSYRIHIRADPFMSGRQQSDPKQFWPLLFTEAVLPTTANRLFSHSSFYLEHYKNKCDMFRECITS